MNDDRDVSRTSPGPLDEDEATGDATARAPEEVAEPAVDRSAPESPIPLGMAADGGGETASPHAAMADHQDGMSSTASLAGGPGDQHVPGAGAPADGDTATLAQGMPATDAGESAPLLSTVCPVCGQTTPANRFCGFCGAPLTEGRVHTASGSGDPILRAVGRLHDAIFPSTQPINLVWHRIVVPVAIVIALIALLANDIGIALIVTAAIAPTLLVLTLRQLDVFERESPLLSGAAAVAGLIGGLIIGGIMSWATRQWWFSSGGFNHGAAGYGAEFAKIAGRSPFLLLLVNGIVLPAIGVAAMLLGPIALRRFNQFRNEAMDGLVLGAIGGAGYVLGTVIVFVAPEIGGAGPTLSVRHWTLLILGLAVFRPLIVTAGAAIFAAGLWRYLMTERSSALIIPATAGVGGIVLLYLGTMILEPRSLALEVGWNLLLTVALAAVLSLVLRQSIAFDRRVIGANSSRIRCPHCGQVTPQGSYCAHCGQPLPGAERA